MPILTSSSLALWKRLFPDTPTSYNSIGMDYRPQVKEILHHSQNAVVARVDGDVVLKHSRYAWWDYPGSESMLAVQDAKNSFQVEGEILKVLGEHPRITK
ncbi:hypothetical protein CEP52_014755 [Fusarium oligoseptatum]|uniref:Uncharacterized protein n=1 Tax=Fusarium oligoseptatum TaxID=2604345 RepID=A0A428SJ85_9HYPO|nr:hypothetical protein CEP52_014755 [Fusarium oligoseptatum]